jgi:hypothetical protein
MLEPTNKTIHTILQPPKEVNLSCHVPDFLEKLKTKLDLEAPYTYEILRKFFPPYLKVIVRLVAFSESFKEARRFVETLANAFSSFNGSYAKFKPKIVRFPILRSSYSILKDIVRRKFPFIDFNQSFYYQAKSPLFHFTYQSKPKMKG